MINKTNKYEMTLTTEELILKAAAKIFTEKGYAAARMDDIANEAGINRALLHYYYRSKEKMFAIIFEKQFEKFFSGVASTLSSQKTIFEKIALLVEHELNMLSQHPDLPLFVLGELTRNPDLIINKLKNSPLSPQSIFKAIDDQLKKEHEAGIIKKIDGASLMINIMALCVYPFAAKALVQFFTGAGREEFIKIASSRKNEIIDFIICGIKA